MSNEHDSHKIKKTPFWLLNYTQGGNPFADLGNSHSEDPLDAPVFSEFDTVEEDRGER